MKEKARIIIVEDMMHIVAPRSKFLPSYLYYLMEEKKCNYVSFENSSKLFKKEDLKGKEDWKDVEQKRNKR